MTREFVYMPTFEKQWTDANLTDDDLKDLEILLCENPEAEKMIQGTGGLRKLGNGNINYPSGGKKFSPT